MTVYDTGDVLASYGLPDLPEPADDPEGTVTLVLFREHLPEIVLAEDISVADAQEYCSRDDTHGQDTHGGFSAGFWQ